MGMPSRTLKAAMDFFALVVTGFWPVMAAEVGYERIHDLDVLGGFAETHVDDYLLELRNRHDVLDVEFLGDSACLISAVVLLLSDELP